MAPRKDVAGTKQSTTHNSNVRPIGTTTDTGYPSRTVPSTAGGRLNTLTMASKSRNSAARALTIRPAQSTFIEGASILCVDSKSARCPCILFLSLVSRRMSDQIDTLQYRIREFCLLKEK